MWVAHLPDRAMVVLIAHVGGLVSLYAHLDDRIAPPRVGAGDQVQQGQIIGAIGMTGMTTGPHLHFVVWRNGELIDPLSVVTLGVYLPFRFLVTAATPRACAEMETHITDPKVLVG